MNCIFIYNPVSGRGKIARCLPRIVQALRERYEFVDVYASEGQGDMVRAAQSAAERYDAIIFSGGDGSFNEVVQGVCASGRSPELGYIPGGTVNDVAHSLGIPKRLGGALSVITGGRRAPLDCMRIGSRYAMYIVAAGAFTSAPYTTPQWQKKQLGRIAYGIEGLKKNLNFDVFGVRVEGENAVIEEDSVFVMFLNGKYVAGMPLNRGGSMQDGKIEAVLIRQRKNPDFLHRVRAFLALANLFLFGTRVRESQLVRLEGKRFTVQTRSDVVWNFDGEMGTPGRVTVEVLPGRLQMLVPRKKKNI